MSLEVASMIESGRSAYATLRSKSYARKAKFASLTGGRQPMKFKPIGLSANARNRAQEIRNGGTSLLQGLLDLTNASHESQVEKVYKTAVEKALEEFKAAQNKSTGALVDETV